MPIHLLDLGAPFQAALLPLDGFEGSGTVLTDQSTIPIGS